MVFIRTFISEVFQPEILDLIFGRFISKCQHDMGVLFSFKGFEAALRADLEGLLVLECALGLEAGYLVLLELFFG